MDAADERVKANYGLYTAVPVYHLAGHGFELVMKAFLLEGGHNEGEVKKLGHKLKDLYEECRRKSVGGKAFPMLDDRLVKNLDGLIRGNTLRYWVDPPKDGAMFPDMGQLAILASKCALVCDALDPEGVSG